MTLPSSPSADGRAAGPVAPVSEDEIDAEMAARLRMAIARLGRQLRQQSGTALTPTLQAMLASIAIHGPLALNELAALERVAPPTVTKILAKLDEQGLIVRQRDDHDRRVTLVSLTEAGAARFEESRTRRTAWLVRRLAELGMTDQARLADTVDLLELLAMPDTGTIGTGGTGTGAGGGSPG